MRLYIDPGTGSMLFTILIAVIGSLLFFLRDLKMRMGVLLSGRREEKGTREKLPLVIFSDDKRYWNVFKPICDELEHRKKPTLYLTESADDPALQCSYEYIHCECIGEGNRAFAKLNFLNAHVLLSTTPGLDVYQWKRSRDVDWYVHLPHAANDITLYRMFGLDYYDAVLLSGEYQIRQLRQLEKLRNLPEKELRIVGVTYMDVMREHYNVEMAQIPEENHVRTILLAPSWGESAILSRYGERIIDALLATGYHLIIRPHPQSFISETEQMQRLMQKYPESAQLEWNRDNDNFEVLRRADLMISDFSGVMFDFILVFDKPLIYADTSFDSAPYDCCWLEEPLWTFCSLPKLGVQLTEKNMSHIKNLIDECIVNPKYKEARRQAREETWQEIGKGTENVVDYLCDKLEALEAAEKRIITA